jgi:hypothetical protein
VTAAVVEREIRRVRVGSTFVPLGVLAGTDTVHRFKPDQTSGTSCLLCFGWYDDYRHAARQRAVVS